MTPLASGRYRIFEGESGSGVRRPSLHPKTPPAGFRGVVPHGVRGKPPENGDLWAEAQKPNNFTCLIDNTTGLRSQHRSVNKGEGGCLVQPLLNLTLLWNSNSAAR